MKLALAVSRSRPPVPYGANCFHYWFRFQISRALPS